MRFYDLERHVIDEVGNTLRHPLEILVRQDEHHIHGKRLGRHLEHDPRSRLFPVEVKADDELKSVKWERYCDAFDQGEDGTCTGNAIGGALMTGPFYESSRIITEDTCREIYSLGTRLDRIPGEWPPDDTGSTGLAVCKAAVKLGYIVGYRHAFSMRAAMKALQSGPVITGFGWYDSFDEPNANGTVEVLAGAVVRGGHETCATELKLEHHADGSIDEENSLVYLWNSWGRDFAINGEYNMSIKTWRYLMKEYGDITVPVPPMG